MNMEKMKYVILMDGDLPKGIAANTAAVLSATIGSQVPELIGPPVVDGAGRTHRGITTLPIAVLTCEQQRMRDVRMAGEERGMLVVGFTRTAQCSLDYEKYTLSMAEEGDEELEYLGLAVFGERKSVAALTGDMGLLR